MKARADDRRLFGQPVVLNVLALQEAKAGSVADLHSALNAPQIDSVAVSQLVEAFEQAKTFGSLIQIPDELVSALPDLRRNLDAVRDGGDMLGRDAAETLLRLVAQAEVLAKAFDAVVANPPYMGGKGMNAELKPWAKRTFPASKTDLFAMFIERGFGWCKPAGYNSMVTMQSWMFLSSFEDMRTRLLEDRTLSCMVHMGNGVMGIAFGTAATIFMNRHINGFDGSFSYCENDDLNDAGVPAQFPVPNDRLKTAKPDDFKKIPGSPVAYWVPPELRHLYVEGELLGAISKPLIGMRTGDNERFLRRWFEVSFEKICVSATSAATAAESGAKWFPYQKGGEYRRWYGNLDYVVNWKNDGAEIKEETLRRYPALSMDNLGWKISNERYYFQTGITWTATSSSYFGVRFTDSGCLFDVKGSFSIPRAEDRSLVLALLSSSFTAYLVKVLNPTIEIQPRDIANIPFVRSRLEKCRKEIEQAALGQISDHVADWNENERSLNFAGNPLVACAEEGSISASWGNYELSSRNRTMEVKSRDESINSAILSAYGIGSEIESVVTDEHITLRKPSRSDATSEMVSYAIGCMMGRYSLDAPGLIYAHAGNEGFDPSRYETFPADDDGIVPITDEAWFDDDGANRIREFVRVVWGESTEAENMAWLAESLGSKASESADDTIRRYLSKGFYKDHLQTYKKRPIYWLFSSGKHKAFEALVYLHRYNAGTLSRMRMEYVVPLQSRMQARIDNLEQDIQASTSSAEQKRFQKQKDKLIKQLDELRRFDESLRHYADQRITLDLDDGVKVNYGKFGDLLAEVKAVTGKK